MNVNIKHLALSISVAVVLFCVFAGVSISIASAKMMAVPNDYDYSTLHPMIDNATCVSGDTAFDYSGIYPRDKLSPSYKIATAPIHNDFYGDILSNIAIVNDTSSAHLTKTASRYHKPTATEHLYGEDVKRFKKAEDDKIYALYVVPHAHFTLEKNFGVGTEDDFIMSGTHECRRIYWLDIYNYDDASDTVLGNLGFSAQADNITGVDRKRFAEWNESYVEWEFPPYPKFTIEEDNGFGTRFDTISEKGYINVDVSRWMNVTEFNADGYQLVKFNVTFKDVDFLWCWGRIEANKHYEVRASIVPDTFKTDAPVDWDEWEHGVHFDFDREQIETNVTYHFSVIVSVEPNAPPIEYKSRFKIGQGLYASRQLGGEGHCVEMPPEMLPEMVHKASACTNISNNWDFRRVDHRFTEFEEVVKLIGPHAEFHFNKDFNVWTKNDTIASGTYERNMWYWMHIENVEDTSGTALSNLSFSAKADSITDVDWGEYAKWNESYVEWNFPAYPRFTIKENEGFGTGFGRGSEIRDVNVSVSRWMNITEFNSSGNLSGEGGGGGGGGRPCRYEYQLAKFNVTFGDTNFEWVWARIEANERHETEASIVPGTFTYDAPLGDFDEWDHGIHFNFDKERIEPGVTYNFSVIVKVKPTGKEAPPILYKPAFIIGEGLYYNSTTAKGHEVEVPTSMLPEHVHNASVSTNVSNAWLIKRHNHIIAGLEEVSELAGPHARFYLGKHSYVWTKNDSIASDTYEPVRYGLNIYNEDDTSDTFLGNLSFSVRADNITDVDREEYAEWNETSAKWTFPPEYVLYEKWDRGRVGLGTGFGTNYTEKVNVSVNRWMNETIFYADGYQLAKFNVTFKDTDFLQSWGGIQAFGPYGVKATIVPETFSTDAPLEWVDEWEHGIYFNFDKKQIEPDKTYNFSVIFKIEITDVATPIVYKPMFYVGKVLNESHGLGEGDCIEMPEEMLPEHVYAVSACTNVSNNWMLWRGDYIYTILEGISEPVMNSTICGYVTEEGWIKNPANGHYYKLTAPMNWLDAEAHAIEWDGHLVTLNGWEEESWIKTVFGENEYFWIGFNDIAEEGNWVWSNGEPVTYTNWAEGEPNNYNNEDAAVMNWGVCEVEPCYGDYWNDILISGSSRGIVESVVEKPTSPIPIPDAKIHLQSISYDNFWCLEDNNDQLIKQWNYTFQPAINRMQFGASPAIADIGVNNKGSDPDPDLEIITGSDECGVYSPELKTWVAGLWHAFDSAGNVEWVKDTQSDQARTSVAIIDINKDGYLEIVGGTTSGETVEVMDRFGNFIWTFPDPPRCGNLMYHSSPAVADVNDDVDGLEVIIGNRPLHTVFCLDGDNSDGIDEGISSNSIDWSSIGEGTAPWEGKEGKDWDILWIYTTNSEIISTPAVGDVDADGSLEVVIGSTDGYVYCLDGATGALKWSYQTGANEVDGSAGLADFDNDGDLEIVIGSTDGKLYFINGDENNNGVIDNAEVTFYQTDGAIHSSPAIGDVNGDGDFEVIVGSNDGKIYSFDYDPAANIATKNWEFATGGAVYSSPALADRTDVNLYDKEWYMFRSNLSRTGFYGVSPSTGLDIYVGSDDGYLYLLHGNNGSLIDGFLTNGAIRTSPSVADVDGDNKLEIFFYDYDSIAGYEMEGSTNEDGYYEINTFAGHFYIGAYKDGYFDYRDEIFVPENETRWVNITIEQKPPENSTVCGFVNDTNGNPIEGAWVGLHDIERDRWANGTDTNSEGYYEIGIYSGHFYIDADKEDYSHYHDEISILENETIWLNFTLAQIVPRETIGEAITDGVAWLAGEQNPDGSWGSQWSVAKTGLAVLKLETHATDLGYPSPFDPAYGYSDEIERGLNYLFSHAHTINISDQTHDGRVDDPDTNGNGIGVYFRSPNLPPDRGCADIYETSIAMMAIAASTTPDKVVNVSGSPVDGWTYKEVLQDAVDYIAWAQTDSGFGRGGWNYEPMDNNGDRSDQSNSGWVTLGLAYAEAPRFGFNLSTPGFVRTELDRWIDYIQNDVDGDTNDGGADYTGPGDPDWPEPWVNMLKTGNLLQQMAFVGDTTDTPRVKDAIDYLVRHWNDDCDPGWRGSPSSYHTTYTVMKGLEALNITTIDSIDWFQDFTDAIMDEQTIDGWWSVCNWDDGERILSTEWALLTLQKITAPTLEKPDLVILEKHEEWVNTSAGTYKVYFTAKNKGNIEAPSGHDVELNIDGVEMEQKEIPVALSPGATYNDIFNVTITLTDSADEITVCADINNEVDELSEDNCVTNIWPHKEFDTGQSKNPYPSIMGTHKGEIKPSQNINVSKLYTYPCAGTGGHTESIELYENDELIASGTWNGYQSDWHNLTLHNASGAPYVMLYEGYEYNYPIVTGSYPQIIHEPIKEVTGGTITCSSFVDANGKTYTDWIPAIRFE